MDVSSGTLVVYSDIGCPWAHAAVYRLHDARRRLGLADAVLFDHRAFPLELFNRRATPKRSLDAEIPVAGALAPAAGWQMWNNHEFRYPVTTLPALEAVQAANAQGLRAGEVLDLRLRRAFFAESRTISLHHELVELASDCPEVDAEQLDKALQQGTHRAEVFGQFERARGDEVQGSPHLFLPDGSSVHNPGVEFHWEGEHGRGFPVVDEDDPSIFEQLLRRAAGEAG